MMQTSTSQLFLLFQINNLTIYLSIMDRLKIALVAAALISGACNTIGFTLQNKQPVVEGDISKHFYHPYMQVAMRAPSMVFSLFIYLARKQRNKNKISERLTEDEEEQITNPKAGLLLYMIPTVLDFFAMICYYIALNFIAGSVYQILRGGTVLTTFLFSYTCLKLRPIRPRIVGCLIVLLGLVIVGIINFTMGVDSKQQKQETLIGYGLIFIGLIANGLQFVYEQHLINKYQANPLKIVGMQGFWGILISLALISSLSFIPCQLGTQACVIKDNGEQVVQDFLVYAREVGDNGLILSGVILVFFSMVTYNTVGVFITKHMNSLTRSICDVTRTVLVWGVGIILTATLGQSDKRFHWQATDGWQIAGQSFGFLVLICGNLVYYEVIKFKGQPKVKNNISTLIDEEYSPSITTED